MVGLIVFLAVTLLSGALWMWKRKSSSAHGHSSTGESRQTVPTPGDDTYTALNPMTMSPDYDTLQNVQGSASDTYTTLNPAAMSSDHDTLRDFSGYSTQ
ncbi:hypothetical protein PGIGA_G00156170 [Pangasianodon gigas]|uniref:Uncharacterized protein n=1 Tax=Pangasianodon gigas TaxID=30993 RepID=A0ACC5XQ40_PANGG|nr:hypothetical protein [Pangasianodon gigas]